VRSGHSPAAVSSNNSPCADPLSRGWRGKANRVAGEGGGEVGHDAAAKLGVRTSVSVDYPKHNRHRQNDKETLWDLES
jgi:hypothetical protein